MFLFLRFCWLNMHLAKSKRIVWIGKQMKIKEKLARKRQKTSMASQRDKWKMERENGSYHVNGLDRTTGSDGSNNVNIFFHRFSCRQLVRKVVRFSSFYVITLRLVIFLSFFSIFVMFVFSFSFYTLFFLLSSVVCIVEFLFSFFRNAHSLWSFYVTFVLVVSTQQFNELRYARWKILFGLHVGRIFTLMPLLSKGSGNVVI